MPFTFVLLSLILPLSFCAFLVHIELYRFMHLLNSATIIRYLGNGLTLGIYI